VRRHQTFYKGGKGMLCIRLIVWRRRGVDEGFLPGLCLREDCLLMLGVRRMRLDGWIILRGRGRGG
jgi:hypothetical protein